MQGILIGTVQEGLSEKEETEMREYVAHLRRMPAEPDIASELAWTQARLDECAQWITNAEEDDESWAYYAYTTTELRRHRDACANELHRRKRQNALPAPGIPKGLAPEFIDSLKRTADIVEIIQGYGIDLKKRGRNWVGCCCFHPDKRPSFSVDASKGVWYCYGCASGGDLIDFLQRVNSEGFISTVRRLCDYAGVQMPTPNGGE